MSTITLPNIRVSSDLTVKVRLKDSGVAIDWSTLTKIKASIYSDAQRALAGRCDVSIDAEDSTLLVCNYAANKPQYVGVNRIVVSAKYMGETKTYDKPAFTFVRWTADQEGEQITIDDPDVDVEISVEDISSSILQEAVDAAFEAADRANDAAAAAEHMVDIHTGPEGKSAYEVAVEEGYVGTEEEWLASLVGPQGAQGIQGETGEAAGFGTVSVSLQEDGGQPSATVAASGTDTAKNFAFTFNNLKGEKGDKGDQGNSGYTGAAGELEVVNNLTDGGSTAALSAEMGKTLEGEVSQLEHEVDGIELRDFNEGMLIPKYVSNSYVDKTDGSFDAYNGWTRTDYINVTLFSSLIITATVASTYNAFYDKDKAFIKAFSLSVGANTVNIPDNASYIVISNTNAGTLATTFAIDTYRFATNTKADGIKDEVIAEVANGIPANYESGRLSVGGNVQHDSYAEGWYVPTYFIPCKQGDVLSWTSGENNGTGRYCLCLYDESKNFINNAYWQPSAQPKSVTITSEYSAAKFVKMSFKLKKSDGVTDNTVPLKINGVDAFTVLDAFPGVKEISETANEALAKADIHRLSSFFTGYYGISGAIQTSKMADWRYAPYKYCPDFIPVNPGDSVVWNFARYDNASQCLIIYDSTKTMLDYYTANTSAGTRTITMPADSAFIRITFGLTMPNNTPNKTPVIVAGTEYIIDDQTLDNNARLALIPEDESHGIIGEVYPEEVAVVENQLEAKLSNRFHFIHISDNHGGSFGYAQEYLDYSPAKFLINTGDLVLDKFADKDLESFQTIDLATEPTKPVYLALGNHDYSHATSRQDVFDAFIAPTNTHNGTVFDKTYYAIDFSTEKVKVIVLDMNDGWPDEDLPDLGPSGNLTWGKMSQTQINWLGGQLQDAITNALHTIIFVHTPPAQVDRFKRENKFSDTIGLDYARNLTFLPGLIDAFINGETASFTYDGNSYSFTFATGGHFVAWICGHEHGDLCGWMEGHENQFVAVVCRPYADTSKFSGSYDLDKLGVHWNYCTVDTDRKSFSVYRMGQQTTIFGTDRVSFRILYK